MVDVVRAVFLVLALAACARARYAAGLAAAGACALVFLLEVLVVVRWPVSTERVELAFGALFLGPTALPNRLSDAAADPLHHVGSAAIAALGARGAFRRSSPLPPDGDDSKLLDRAGLRLLALAVLAGLESVAGLLGHLLRSGD